MPTPDEITAFMEVARMTLDALQHESDSHREQIKELQTQLASFQDAIPTDYAVSDHDHYAFEVHERTMDRLGNRIDRVESRLQDEERARENEDYSLERKIEDVKGYGRRSSGGR